MNAQPLQPGDLVLLAGWPCPVAMVVLEVTGNLVQLQAGNLKITANRASITAVHQPCRK